MEMMIYAIAAVKENPDGLIALLSGTKGISGAGLDAVGLNEISAVVSEVIRTDVIADQSNALAYAGVIETLAEHFTLLPVRFGSVMKSIDAVANILEKNYGEILCNLQKVDNKYEFGLKVFCDPGKIQADMKAASEAGNEPFANPASESGNSVFREYVNRKLKEHRLEQSRLKYVESVIAEITGCLAGFQSINKFKKMTSETTIIDALFLLDKERKAALIHSVGDWQSKYSGLNFVLTGPWPPYNFVDFTVQ